MKAYLVSHYVDETPLGEYETQGYHYLVGIFFDKDKAQKAKEDREAEIAKAKEEEIKRSKANGYKSLSLEMEYFDNMKVEIKEVDVDQVYPFNNGRMDICLG